MALVIKDRVKQTTTTTGTGTLTLNGTVDGFQTFAAALSDGDTTYYALLEPSTNEWEVGLGTWTEGSSFLARTTVLASSNAGSAVNLTAQAEVFITQPATKAAFFNADGDLELNQDPTSALHAATKEYVDTIAAAGLHYHDPVRVEKEGNLNVTYDNGTAGVGATLTNAGTQEALVIDGVTMVVGDRVLVYEQTDATQNGVYTVTNVGSGSTNWVLTRSTDTDSYAPSDPTSFGKGDAFFVLEGNAGAGELYVMNTEGTITFGTTDITFTQVASTAVYSAGNGLTLTGTVFAADAGTGVTVDGTGINIGQQVETTSDVTFNTVTADLTGSVTGNVTGDVTGNADTATALETARNIGGVSFDGTASINLPGVNTTGNQDTTGNAATATAWATGRTISLTGDVTGSVTGVDGTGNASIATTIAANSVALGTDTTGDYVSTVTSGNYLTGGTTGEGSTPTLNVDATPTNTASKVVARDASGNFSAGTITAALSGNASTASTLATARNIAVTGAVTGNANFDGSGNISIATTATSDPTVTLTGAVTGSGTMTNLGNVSIATTATADPTLTLSGDASGSATFTNLGNATLNVTVANDSHTHDGRYYTESEADSRFVNATGDTMSGNLSMGDNNVTDIGKLNFENHEGSDYGVTGDVMFDENFYDDTEYGAAWSGSNGGGLAVYNEDGWGRILTDRNIQWHTATFDGLKVGSNTVWHSGNDGSGSGLDADTVDGVHESTFMRKSANSSLDMNNNNITDVEDIYLQDRIYHDGDTDTYIQFGTNTINFSAGNDVEMFINASGVFVDNSAIHEDYDALAGTSPSIDVNAGGAFSLTMTGNTTFTFGGTTSGYGTGFVLQLTGNGSTVTWPSSVDWAGGTAPDAPASGETDIYVFWTRDGGTTWYGVLSVDAAA